MSFSVGDRRMMVEKDEVMSVSEQCTLLGIHRSGFYYVPGGQTDLNLELMAVIDHYFLEHPHTGVLSMCAYLCMTLRYVVNVKRIRRLMRLMGLIALYPGKKLSLPDKGHRKYPYLLRDMVIHRNNQVWQTDITYIPMKKGFMYMMAVIDVNSRYIVHWSVSNTMDAAWCTQVISEAFELCGAPDIVNTDQGSQYTAHEFQGALSSNGVQISMDGKGRALDNIFIERFWRSLKYEHVYLKPAMEGLELYRGLQVYMDFYNTERRHESLDYRTPAESYISAAA